MCGIIGIHFKNPRDIGISRDRLEDLVDEMLLGIEHRGYHATGLLTVDSRGKSNLVKADINASTFVWFRERIPRRVRTILGHTRYATQGSPQNLDNNHPVQYDSCFAIHNGHIANDSELFKKHSLGRHAEVDSEIIPALFHKFGLDKAHLALQELEGGFATAIVDPVRFPNMTILAKGDISPCEVLETDKAIIWASEARTIQDAAENVLGFRPAYSKIKSLHPGDILLMEGETVEKLEFKVKARTWTNKTTTTTTSCSTSTLPSNPRTWRIYEECKNCGCARIWHGSAGDFSGSCNHHQLGTNKKCKCEKWVEPEKKEVKPLTPLEQTNTTKAWEYCDGCGRSFYCGDLKLIGTRYLCPTLCAKDDEKVTEAEKTQKPRPRKPEELLIRKRAEDVLLVQQLKSGKGSGVVSDTAGWEAREEAINLHACQMAALKTGMSDTYIDWLVNNCTNEIVEGDSSGYLNEARTLAGKAYFDAWTMLDDEIEDIETWAWQDRLAAERARGSEDRRDEEECGVVVEMSEYREEVTA